VVFADRAIIIYFMDASAGIRSSYPDHDTIMVPVEGIWDMSRESPNADEVGRHAATRPGTRLISVLVGIILAFVGAVQLRMFEAQIYIADLVGIAMLREMGALMTAIIMSGRTGASYATQPGTMEVNEEIDALKTLGITPVEFLALPRIIALNLAALTGAEAEDDPWRRSRRVAYRLSAKLTRLDGAPSGEAVLDVSWVFENERGQGRPIERKSHLLRPVDRGGFHALAEAYSLLIADFSREVAQEITRLPR